MEEKLLDEFIKYAKESYGYNITTDSLSAPDSFEDIFGASFLTYCEEPTIEYENNITECEYINTELKISSDFSSRVDCGITNNTALAA